MNASLATRIAMPVLAVLFGAPLTAKADHYDRAFDYIERYADSSAERARHVFGDVLHDVHDRGLRAQMLAESRAVMSGFAQIRVLARVERVDRMETEVHRVMSSLRRLDELVHVAERDEWHAHAGHGPDVHHIHELILDLIARAKVLDGLIHDLQGPPVRYETGYRTPRPVTSRVRVYESRPSGVYIGGPRAGIRIGTP